jgi:hypothetical protein
MAPNKAGSYGIIQKGAILWKVNMEDKIVYLKTGMKKTQRLHLSWLKRD